MDAAAILTLSQDISRIEAMLEALNRQKNNIMFGVEKHHIYITKPVESDAKVKFTEAITAALTEYKAFLESQIRNEARR